MSTGREKEIEKQSGMFFTANQTAREAIDQAIREGKMVKGEEILIMTQNADGSFSKSTIIA